MPEYLWSRMFFNILGFLICLNKNKYGWINLENARICLKYNVKDTVKYSIFKRKSAFRTVSNNEDGAFVKMFSMVLSIYPEAWIRIKISLTRIYQGSKYARDTESTECAWVYSWMFSNMSEYAWNRSQNDCTS